MKLSFRVTLLSAMLSVLLGTVAINATLAWRAGRQTVAVLADQVLGQVAARIEQEIRGLLTASQRAGELAASRVGRAGDDHLHLASELAEILAADPHLAYLSWGRAADGEYCHAQRRGNGTIVLLTSTRGGRPFIRRDYDWRDGVARQTSRHADYRYDPRERPFYRAARAAGEPVWTDVYAFLDEAGVDLPGVTLARPITGRDGALRGVVTVDLEITRLSDFLAQLDVGRGGLVFVVEETDVDAAPHLIAHPDANRLLVSHGDSARPRSVAELGDPVLTAVLARGPLAESPRLVVDGVAYLAAVTRLSQPGDPAWRIGVVLPEAALMTQVVEARRQQVLWAGLAVLTAVLFSIWITAAVARPLAHVAAETRAISQFEVEARPVAHSLIREVDDLSGGVEQMKTGLRSFGKFVPRDVVRGILADGQEIDLGGRRAEVTILFADMVGFTPLAESLEPEALVCLLGRFLGELTQAIGARGGTVDKFTGDGVMAFWGAPAANPHHAAEACLAALAAQAALARLRAECAADGRPAMQARIGLNSGAAVVGCMGSRERLNYTVAGDAVNLASRLEALGKVYGAGILISEATAVAAAEAIVARPIDRVTVPGRAEPLLICEALPAGDTERTIADLSGEALEQYRRRDFAGAAERYRAILAVRPADSPATAMLERCRTFATWPPPAGWDGVFRVEVK